MAISVLRGCSWTPYNPTRARICTIIVEGKSDVRRDMVDTFIQGIPTYPELLKRATALEKTVRQMAYLEPNRGGLASLALARLAAGLKVNLIIHAGCRMTGRVFRSSFNRPWALC